jgi:hypothetical protein
MFICTLYSCVLLTFDCLLSVWFCYVYIYLCYTAVWWIPFVLSVYSWYVYMYSIQLCVVNIWLFVFCVVLLCLYIFMLYSCVHIKSTQTTQKVSITQLYNINIYKYNKTTQTTNNQIVCMLLSYLCVLYTAVCCQHLIVCCLYVFVMCIYIIYSYVLLTFDSMLSECFWSKIDITQLYIINIFVTKSLIQHRIKH